jgi:hypothetical protein
MIRAALAAVVAVCVIGSAACGPNVDLSKGLEVTDVLTGYYDAGLKDGWNYLKPSITFRLRNTTEEEIGPVQLTVAFWRDGEEDEWDSTLMQAIRAGGLPAGATTDSLLARAPNVGYKLEGARADFFAHSIFRDVSARLFATRAGKFYPLGEFKLDRVIIPQVR